MQKGSEGQIAITLATYRVQETLCIRPHAALAAQLNSYL